jgi:hypothetical protein
MNHEEAKPSRRRIAPAGRIRPFEHSVASGFDLYRSEMAPTHHYANPEETEVAPSLSAEAKERVKVMPEHSRE